MEHTTWWAARTRGRAAQSRARLELNGEVWGELEDAHRRLVRHGRVLERAVEEGWSIPGCCRSPLRCLVLMVLLRDGPMGVPPSRLAQRLGVPRPTLAHHLDVLEGADLVRRSRRGLGDERRVSVRLTPTGASALALVQAALERGQRRRGGRASSGTGDTEGRGDC